MKVRFGQIIDESRWHLWTTQLLVIVRMELKKNLFKRRSLWIYLVAFAPVMVIAAHAFANSAGNGCSIDEDTKILAGIFQVYYLRLGIFFGCLGLFTWLFRGDIVEKSLHYYFLAPVRRELLALAKFLAGVLSSIVMFGLAVFLSFAFMYGHLGPQGSAFVFGGPGLNQLFQYLGVTVLGCLGYGSVFMALSLVFRNPVLPGICVLLWESFHIVFPAALQR